MLCGSRPSRLGRRRLSFEKRTEREALPFDNKGLISRSFHGLIASCSYRLRITFAWSASYLISFVMSMKRKSIVIAPAPSLMTCQFRRVRLRKKSDIRVAIYYFDFMPGNGVEIDRVCVGPFNYIAFNGFVGSLLFGRCFVYMPVYYYTHS